MSGMVVIRFNPTSRMGFMNNVQIAGDMINLLGKLKLINVVRMSMGDNKLYVYLD